VSHYLKVKTNPSLSYGRTFLELSRTSIPCVAFALLGVSKKLFGFVSHMGAVSPAVTPGVLGRNRTF
jgi:hypothetical protein